jgi:hypothetical protein
LQGHHRSRDGARPRHRRAHDGSGGCDHDRLPQARLLLCADPDCRAQAVICRDCDRGHIYCADCGPHARRRSLHAAGRRYQASHRGRVRHAERARRYRARQNKVTHHGSPPHRSDAVLATDPVVVVVEQQSLLNSRSPARGQRWCCLCCGRRCSEHVRQGFLPRRVHRNRRRGPDHDHSI